MHPPLFQLPLIVALVTDGDAQSRLAAASVKPGGATVSASAGGKLSEPVQVRVPAVSVVTDSCKGDALTLAPGDSLQLKVSAQPSGAVFHFCPGTYRMQSV